MSPRLSAEFHIYFKKSKEFNKPLLIRSLNEV